MHRDFTKQLRLGIVGLPNIGKSTLFNALTGSSVAASNFPFTTIDPSTSKVMVPDKRFERLVEHFQPKKRTPAFVSVTDIAGLVKGAAEGKGLGNAFLSHIRAVHGIFHLVRGFEAETISHVEGNVDPVRDIKIIDGELQLKDLEMAEKQREAFKKATRRAHDAEAEAGLKLLDKVEELILKGKDVRDGTWSKKELEALQPMMFLTAKPVSYLVNLSEEQILEGADTTPSVQAVQQFVAEGDKEFTSVVPFSGELEEMFTTLDKEEVDEYCAERGVESMLPRIANAGYRTLDLIHYFTCGPDEVRAWTIRRGCGAAEAAGLIHSDFEKFFVGADVTPYKDFVESDGKAEGKGLRGGRWRHNALQNRCYQVKVVARAVLATLLAFPENAAHNLKFHSSKKKIGRAHV